MLRRVQFQAGQLTEKELRRAAFWAAVVVIGAIAVTWVVYFLLPGGRLFGRRLYYLAFMFATVLPLVPGLLVGGGIGSLVTLVIGRGESAAYWITFVVSLAFNWYFYFALFSYWIYYLNKRKQHRAAAHGT